MKYGERNYDKTKDKIAINLQNKWVAVIPHDMHIAV